MLNYNVLSKVHFFQHHLEIPGFFESFFGGFLLTKGLPIFVQMGFLLSFALSIFTALQCVQQKNRVFERITAASAFCSLFLASLLLFQPWDELFIYLRHAQNLALRGNFSFNQFERIDGIVDFLPFFSLGLLHKVGFPLVETHFFLQIAAGWFCILGARKILAFLKLENSNVWSYPLLVIYPPLLLNAANGFTFLFFTAFIIWSVVLLVLSENEEKPWFLGCLVLSLVPLVRLEGVGFCILLFIYLCFTSRHILSMTRLLLCGGIIFLPVSGLSLWKLFYFGSAIPVPITYKSSFGSVFFSLMGLRNFLMDWMASGSALCCFFILVWHTKKGGGPKSPAEQKAYHIFLLILAFCIPYYLSGGDWFPPAFGRYLFPFSFFTYIFSLAIFFRPVEFKNTKSTPSTLLFFVLTASILLLPFGSAERLALGLFARRTSLSGIHQRKVGRNNYRIHYLSQLGNHLKATTSPSVLIGSSEIATIMYFAEREALDLLGVTNIDIARSPLRETPELFSKIKDHNELPHLIFKRLKPNLVFEKRPGIFYPFDFMLKDLLDTDHLEDITEADLLLALKRWERKFRWLNDTLFSGLEKLMKNGYEPVLVRYGSDFCSLYFVSKEMKEEHFSLMRGIGMVEIPL